MGLIFRDRFDRTGATLGAGWTEQGSTNMSTDGDFVRIDASGVFHIATAAGTSAATQYVQCWCRPDSSPASNAGVIVRFQDVNNFYYIFADPTGSPRTRLVRRKGGVSTTIASGNLSIVNSDDWNLLSVIISGNRIQVWTNNRYNTTSGTGCPAPCEGPDIDFTDTVDPLTGSGGAGITSSGNNGTGASGPAWNDFRVSDGIGGNTVYINGTTGANGYGDGEEDAPMPSIEHALNIPATVSGTRLKFQDDGPYLNSVASNSEYRIGHAGKFDTPGFSFPTYSDDTGEVLDPGSPNLIIEGCDGASRTVLREDVGLNPFFRLRRGARGVVFRGLIFESTSILRAVYGTADTTGDQSFSIDKCHVKAGPTGGAVTFAMQAPATAIRATYSWFEILAGTNLNTDIFDFLGNASPRSSLFRMCLCTGNCDFFVNYTQLMDTWQSGDVHDCDHITFRTADQAARTKAAVAILQPNLIAAGSRLTIQNTITFIDGPEGGLSSGYGVYFGNTNVPAGTMEEHHNGFDGEALDACTGPVGNASTDHTATTCNIAAGDPDLDPDFNNPSGTFTWQHTAGAGLNGEGTFAALVVPDLRVNNVTHYKDQADDSTALQVLDKGALQDYVTPAPPGGGSEPAEDLVARFCVSVIFDPGGAQEHDLSTRLLISRPIKLEKDILLHRYRANDIDLQFSDPDSMFVTLNPSSFLLDSNGDPNWYNKEVEVVASFGTSPVVRFVGFVIGLEADRGVGRLRIANRFQMLAERPVRANTLGRISSTNGDAGIGPASNTTHTQAPATGVFLGTINNGPTGVAGINTLEAYAPAAQTYTLVFHEGGIFSTFSVTGSVSGFEGRGQYNTAFSWVSATNALAINPFTGGDIIGGTPAKGSSLTFEVVWRPTAGSTIIEAILEFLLDPLGCGLTTADLDLPSFTALQGTVADQTLPNIPLTAFTYPRLAAREGNCLDALSMMALHAGCVLVETSDAKLGLSSFMPRVVGEIETICTTADLMESKVAHLPIYNEFLLQHTFEERTQQYSAGRIWPDVTDNDSITRNGRRLPAPNPIAFRGYDSSNTPWVEAIGQVLYLRYKDPARTYPITAKVERLDAELTDVYRLSSVAPDALVSFVEPFSIDKQITGRLEVEMELVELDASLVSTECGGYLGYDDPDEGYDDECWGYF